MAASGVRRAKAAHTRIGHHSSRQTAAWLGFTFGWLTKKFEESLTSD
jgi:hypothetical protein